MNAIKMVKKDVNLLKAMRPIAQGIIAISPSQT